MSGDFLPHDVGVDVLAAAIDEAQAKCRVRRADARALARRVVAQLFVAHRVAEAAGTTVAGLHVSGTFWEGNSSVNMHELTLVTVSRWGIRVVRNTPGTSAWNGKLNLTLSEDDNATT